MIPCMLDSSIEPATLTDPMRGSTRTFKLRPFRCNLLQVQVTCEASLFDLTAFRKAVGREDDDDKGLFRFSTTCSTRNRQKADYHVHAEVNERSDQRVRVAWGLHAGASKPDAKEQPPFAEDFTDWIVKFFATDQRLRVVSRGAFEFPSRDVQSIFSLPITVSPLLIQSPSPLLTGAEVVGVRIRFAPNDSGVQDAIHELAGDQAVTTVESERLLSRGEIEPRAILTSLHQAAVALTTKGGDA